MEQPVPDSTEPATTEEVVVEERPPSLGRVLEIRPELELTSNILDAEIVAETANPCRDSPGKEASPTLRERLQEECPQKVDPCRDPVETIADVITAEPCPPCPPCEPCPPCPREVAEESLIADPDNEGSSVDVIEPVDEGEAGGDLCPVEGEKPAARERPPCPEPLFPICKEHLPPCAAVVCPEEN